MAGLPMCVNSVAEPGLDRKDLHDCAASVHTAVHAVQEALPHALHKQLGASAAVHAQATAAASSTQHVQMLPYCSRTAMPPADSEVKQQPKLPGKLSSPRQALAAG